jgi:hypothetical protein
LARTRSLVARATIRDAVSQSHESKLPFWSGNLVVASSYAAAFFECFSELLFHAFG